MKIKYISPIAFYRLYLSNAKLKIIDVREINEFEEYHIRDSINIPFNLLITKPHLFINNKYTYYIVCKDSTLSKRVVSILSEQGYNVICVFGGLKSWRGEFAYEDYFY